MTEQSLCTMFYGGLFESGSTHKKKKKKTDVTIHFGGLNASVLFPQHRYCKSNLAGPKTHVPTHVLYIHFHLSFGFCRIYKSTEIKPKFLCKHL